MIRKATQEDIPKLYLLYKKVELDRDKLNDIKYKQNIQLYGYVFGSSSEEKFEKEIKDSLLTLIYEKGDQILGFVLINNETYLPEDDDDIVWVKPKLKNIYFKKHKTATLCYIVTDPKQTHKQIGSKLLKETEKRLKMLGIDYVFLIIQIFPIINIASVSFHSKQNYSVACITFPKDMRFKNFMSMVMGKSLSANKL